MTKKYTNKYNLPPEVVAALTADNYHNESEDPFDQSASSLVAPTQLRILSQRYDNELKVFDVSSFFWRFMGNIAHNVLENAWRESMESVVEKRFYVDIDGTVLSGKTDCYSPPEIRDYKSCKAYKIIKGATEGYKEWEQAQNIYAYILKKNNLPVERIKIIAIVFDWKEHQTYEANYPHCPFIVIDLPLWDTDQQERFIKERIARLKEGEALTDLDLSIAYPCSNEEMWRTLKDVCVIKHGAARATKVFKDGNREQLFQQAYRFCEEKGYSFNDYQVKERWSPRIRCQHWCPVAHKCAQHKQLSIEEGVYEEPADENLLF